MLGEWPALLRGEPVQARQILRKVITGRLRTVPEIRDDGGAVRTSHFRQAMGLLELGAGVEPATY
jgi:hypothetical protein